MILYWILLLSTNICKSRFDFDIYLTIQSFRCKRTLISGVSIITGTILKHKKSKAQKVKVAAVLQPLSLWTHMKYLLWKKLELDPPVLPPLPPLLFSSLCPESLLTEALGLLIWPKLMSSSSCSHKLPPDPWGWGRRRSSQLRRFTTRATWAGAPPHTCISSLMLMLLE